jgi:hypothetical protein
LQKIWAVLETQRDAVMKEKGERIHLKI